MSNEIHLRTAIRSSMVIRYRRNVTYGDWDMNLYQFTIARHNGTEEIHHDVFIAAPNMLAVIKSKMPELQQCDVVAITKHVGINYIIQQEKQTDDFCGSVQVEDDMRYEDVLKRDALDTQFDGADEMMSQKDDDGWIEWKGGACPVNESTYVDLLFNDGTIFYRRQAGLYRWINDCDPQDIIIAYRVVKNDSDVHGC